MQNAKCKIFVVIASQFANWRGDFPNILELAKEQRFQLCIKKSKSLSLQDFFNRRVLLARNDTIIFNFQFLILN